LLALLLLRFLLLSELLILVLCSRSLRAGRTNHDE
jgi:hypothetical protein